MKRSTFLLLTLGLLLSSLFSPSLTLAATLEDLMKQIGTNFNDLKKIVLVNKNLGPEARTTAQALNTLLYEALPIEPNLNDITNDPAERERLLILYRKIMSETLAASFETELQIVKADLAAATAGINLLANKRREAHDIFRPREK